MEVTISKSSDAYVRACMCEYVGVCVGACMSTCVYICGGLLAYLFILFQPLFLLCLETGSLTDPRTCGIDQTRQQANPKESIMF